MWPLTIIYVPTEAGDAGCGGNDNEDKCLRFIEIRTSGQEKHEKSGAYLSHTGPLPRIIFDHCVLDVQSSRRRLHALRGELLRFVRTGERGPGFTRFHNDRRFRFLVLGRSHREGSSRSLDLVQERRALVWYDQTRRKGGPVIWERKRSSHRPHSALCSYICRKPCRASSGMWPAPRRHNGLDEEAIRGSAGSDSLQLRHGWDVRTYGPGLSSVGLGRRQR